MVCGKCNKEISEGQKFCPECGARADGGDASQKSKSGTFIYIGVVAVAFLAIIAVIGFMAKNSDKKLGGNWAPGGASNATGTVAAQRGDSQKPASANHPADQAPVPAAYFGYQAENTPEQQNAPRGPAIDWNYETFKRLMRESGRKVSLSESEYGEVHDRKAGALDKIKTVLTSRFGKPDPDIMRAFNEIPREYYQYHYQGNQSVAKQTYDTRSKPWGIGYGSALSDYVGQAYMTQLGGVGADSVVLEIGTGSGFQSSILSRIVKEVYSIEIIEPLGKAVAKLYGPLGLKNVHTRVGDGYFGWPDVKGGFDMIMLTCSASYVSPELIKQLKPGGRLIVPIGQPYKKDQFLYLYTKDKDEKMHSKKDVGMYFIPMKGAIEDDKKEE